MFKTPILNWEGEIIYLNSESPQRFFSIEGDELGGYELCDEFGRIIFTNKDYFIVLGKAKDLIKDPKNGSKIDMLVHLVLKTKPLKVLKIIKNIWGLKKIKENKAKWNYY